MKFVPVGLKLFVRILFFGCFSGFFSVISIGLSAHAAKIVLSPYVSMNLDSKKWIAYHSKMLASDGHWIIKEKNNPDISFQVRYEIGYLKGKEKISLDDRAKKICALSQEVEKNGKAEFPFIGIEQIKFNPNKELGKICKFSSINPYNKNNRDQYYFVTPFDDKNDAPMYLIHSVNAFYPPTKKNEAHKVAIQFLEQFNGKGLAAKLNLEQGGTK